MILDEIISKRKETIALCKKQKSIDALKEEIAQNKYPHYSLFKALNITFKDLSPKTQIIAEVKKASPSRGVICEVFDYIDIARSYERGGAAAISVLTEPYYFQGDNRYLTEIKEVVKVPVLRKDFIIDEWQIYEAKAIGADAILLIVAALGQEELERFLNIAHDLELDVLVETHDEEEVERAIRSGAKIIGVNNRDLKTFEVSLEVSKRLSKRIPKEHLFVAESGVKTTEDIRFIKSLGAHAVLIGEGVVKAYDREACLKELLEA